MHLKTLDRKQPIIVVCEDGKTSQAAAFLLLRNKFDASILEGGMTAVDTSTQSAPAFLIDDGVEIDVKTVPENSTDIEQETRPTKDDDEPSIDVLQKRIIELENQCAALKAEKQAILQKYQQLQQKLHNFVKNNFERALKRPPPGTR
ncbi:rhodanese-like domain-containing protein [methane-oxidizing endosymbiont of Gigantopelta aegis]|uniref:rhodanese-like domain-containing protein n=1 Tax=methane-oxidizing endosymbiont of Gigantopelta aegis TaxID=2794938 RepID=UPI0018DC7B21|nr:rhodanese-like domain-containing protein [methane-oxidizing endosymbiont of Gigantopelta aegis]